MGSYVIKSYDVECSYDEKESIDYGLAEFAKYLFREGFIDVNTKYNKETGELYRVLHINANKKFTN